jgi:hypothetical protein
VLPIKAYSEVAPLDTQQYGDSDNSNLSPPTWMDWEMLRRLLKHTSGWGYKGFSRDKD